MIIDIVMTTWGREEMTRRSIRSIQQNTITPYRLIIVDNGSDNDRGFRDWLANTADIAVMLDKNYGLEHAKHIGMQFVESEYFISTDNDILASKPRVDQILDGQEVKIDWLYDLIHLMSKYPEYGAITCRPQVLVGTGNIFTDGDITEFNHIPGYLRIMKTEAVKKTGAWDIDRSPLRGHEEYWISQRLNDMGYKTGWANNIRCFHMFGEENWGYDSRLKPKDHGHDVVHLPKDSQFDLGGFE